MKGTAVVAGPSRAGLWRGRVEPSLRLGPRASFDLAYEQRLRVASGESRSSGTAIAVLPSDSPPAYRLTPLDWEIAAGQHAAWRHEIDRAVLRVAVSRLEIGVGRQAIGWGRGVLFGAVDLFSPFSPFEADREWRRGIDAIRVDAHLSSRASADAVLALGDRWSESAFAGRLRGYAGEVDVEVVAGRRARDTFGGAATSFAIGQAEAHVEVAAFRTDAVAGSRLFGDRRTVLKAVVGGSSRLPVAAGLLVHLEYHYSGFGVRRAQDVVPALTDGQFVARILRGDTQILTRHAVAVVASYEWSPLVAASTALVHEPTDGSGVLTPSLTLTFTDRWSLLVSGYLSYGRDALGSEQRSAYGASPSTGLVQVRFYR